MPGGLYTKTLALHHGLDPLQRPTEEDRSFLILQIRSHTLPRPQRHRKHPSTTTKPVFIVVTERSSSHRSALGAIVWYIPFGSCQICLRPSPRDVVETLDNDGASIESHLSPYQDMDIGKNVIWEISRVAGRGCVYANCRLNYIREGKLMHP